LAPEPGRFLLCFVVPWWFPCRVDDGQGHFSIEEELLDRGGAIFAGRCGDGLRRLLLRFSEGRSCSRSRSDFWSSSVWWTEGGRSRMSDPRCVEHWRVSRLIFSTRSIGSALGGPPMQLLKPGWARVLHRVRRGSPAKCGDVEDCSLTRDLLVISRFWRVFLDVFGHVSFSVFRFDRLLACVRCNLSV
jgi:hypothetical protein